MILSIIIPMFNEEEHILKMFEKLLAVKMPIIIDNIEYIVVDDASKDNSYGIVSNYIKNHIDKNIKLIRHTVNKGKGAAVKTGMINANGDVFLIQDADLELSPSDIPNMIKAMDTLKIEFVNGSRYMPGIARPLASYRRYLGNKFFSLITSIILNVRITDMACGYKLFKRELYEKINLEENGFGFEAELLIKALKVKKNNIAEVPIQYFPRNMGEGKKLKNSDALKILKVIIKYSFFKKNNKA